ncbi:MAG: DUF6687 family protein, partial [Tumebacillaceae bacterium]
MIPHFFITGSTAERPVSVKTIFADGSADKTFREGVDMELSHWLPNRTPAEYKADTSTEICMNFVAAQSTEGWDLAINNHLDVDGVLSIFTLVHSEFALKHRDTIVGAAQMGDFWAWGERPVQVLFQGLTLFFMRLKQEKVDVREIYERCFERVFALVELGAQRVWEEAAQGEDAEIRAGLEALQSSLARVESGQIGREAYGARLSLYTIPAELAQADLQKALLVPPFNAPLTEMMWLLPTVRDKFDHEKVHLVATEGVDGWYYDLWYPGYMWAETPNSWQAPGFSFSGSTNGHYYGYEPLNAVVAQLQAQEQGAGTWTLATELSPFNSIKGRNFPVVLSFVDADGMPMQSKHAPQDVAERLAAV